MRNLHSKSGGADNRREAAETIGIQALAYLAGHDEELGRFLSLSGLDAGEIRAAAQNPDFLAAVLDFVLTDESLLLAFAANAGMSPESIDRARQILEGPGHDRGGA